MKDLWAGSEIVRRGLAVSFTALALVAPAVAFAVDDNNTVHGKNTFTNSNNVTTNNTTTNNYSTTTNQGGQGGNATSTAQGGNASATAQGGNATGGQGGTANAQGGHGGQGGSANQSQTATGGSQSQTATATGGTNAGNSQSVNIQNPVILPQFPTAIPLPSYAGQPTAPGGWANALPWQPDRMTYEDATYCSKRSRASVRWFGGSKGKSESITLVYEGAQPQASMSSYVGTAHAHGDDVPAMAALCDAAREAMEHGAEVGLVSIVIRPKNKSGSFGIGGAVAAVGQAVQGPYALGAAIAPSMGVANVRVEGDALVYLTGLKSAQHTTPSPTAQPLAGADYDLAEDSIKISAAMPPELGVGPRAEPAARAPSSGALKNEPLQVRTTKSVIAHATYDVDPGQYAQWRLPSYTRTGRIAGNAWAVGGAGHDIRVLVLTEPQFERWSRGQATEHLYDSGQRSVVTFSVAVAGPGVYYLVLDNTFSVFSAKRVTADIRLVHEGTDIARGQESY